jgi:peptidylprolyl isomerase
VTIGERELQKAAKREAHKQAMAARQAAAQRQNALMGVVIAIVAIGAIAGLLAVLGVFSPKKQANASTASDTTATAAPTQPASSPTPKVTPPAALATKPVVTKGGTAALTKLDVKTLVQGTGAKVEAGQTITVNYVGVTLKDGKEFDSSWSRGEPASFPIGVQQVIPGWDQGLVGVTIGSRVQLDIPADLAYGTDASSGRPVGDLRFVVDILAATAAAQ